MTEYNRFPVIQLPGTFDVTTALPLPFNFREIAEPERSEHSGLLFDLLIENRGASEETAIKLLASVGIVVAPTPVKQPLVHRRRDYFRLFKEARELPNEVMRFDFANRIRLGKFTFLRVPNLYSQFVLATALTSPVPEALLMLSRIMLGYRLRMAFVSPSQEYEVDNVLETAKAFFRTFQQLGDVWTAHDDESWYVVAAMGSQELQRHLDAGGLGNFAFDLAEFAALDVRGPVPVFYNERGEYDYRAGMGQYVRRPLDLGDQVLNHYRQRKLNHLIA